jgi:hypothetical protein
MTDFDICSETSSTGVNAPSGPTGKATEYLEKLVTDGLKREIDQDENVVRSLPFFATSLGVLITFIGFARNTLPEFTLTLWPILTYGLMAAILASLAFLLWFLAQAVRVRTFNYPMSELDLIRYAVDLTRYYQEAEPTRGDGKANRDGSDADPVAVVERAVIDDLRAAMTQQCADAAVTSRFNNSKRLKARARALTILMAALSFALSLIIVILIHDALEGGPNGQCSHPRPAIEGPSASKVEIGSAAKQAGGAADAPGREGSLDLRGGGS